jgi:poly(3-hydroxybutyrate) depolymerase
MDRDDALEQIFLLGRPRFPEPVLRAALSGRPDISKTIKEKQVPIFTSPNARCPRRNPRAGISMTAALGLALAVPLLSAMPAQAIAAEAAPLARNMVSVNGRDRSYLYHVPASYRRDGFNFVVYVLPDNGQSADAFDRQTGWRKLADEQNFVVVFLEPEREGWAPNSGGEDAYVKAVYDHAIGHLTIGAPGAGGGRGGAGGGAAGAAPPAGAQGERAGQPAAGAGGAGGGAPGGAPGGGAPRAPRAQTWVPFHFVTGAGAGATVAQEFVINNPGVFAAIATLDGAPFDAAYAKGAEPAQGYYQNMRPGKNAPPVWKQLKKDVPVAAWLFTTGEPTPAEAKVVDYWKRSSAVAPAAQAATIDGFATKAFRNAANPAQQIRTTQLGETDGYSSKLTSAIWNDFFAHTARWTSSPNGDLGTMLTEAETRAAFDTRSFAVGDKSYQYYVKAPSSYQKGQSLPLVIAAHGAFLPAWLYASQIRMHDVGEKEGFITVYVNGQQNRWDFTDPAGSDAKFIEGVIGELAGSYGIDRSRVYMQGFSLGSGISYMMGITHPQLFAAVSPNNGIGPMAPAVKAKVAELKAQGDVRIPMMIVYGDVDNAGSVDAKIPAQGVLRGAIDEIKAYNNITTPDQAVSYNSPNAMTYDVLVPGARLVKQGVDKRYKDGRFQISTYLSADPKPLNLLSFVWVTDMSHGQDPRSAQLEWDYFKQWRRNADGTLTYSGR